MSTLGQEPDAQLWDPYDVKPLPKPRLTEEEFVQWCDADTRAEWVDGEVIMMSPSNIRHAEVTKWLLILVDAFVRSRKLGKVFITDVQVRFATQKTRRLPDLLFVASDRLHIIKKTYIEGPPDLMIEVVSPDSSARDWRVKYLEYEKAGVREYWVIDPMAERLEAYFLDAAGKYQRLPETEARVNSIALAGLYIKPTWLLLEELPDVGEIIRELGLV
jgi:Uma2 family endonuclease